MIVRSVGFAIFKQEFTSQSKMLFFLIGYVNINKVV